jgi:hypothetical protein
VIELRDTVEIDATPLEVWTWLESMPDHILEWHPDHLAARWVKGGELVPGAVMEVRERLHGKPHRMRMKLTACEPGRWARYRIFPGLGGSLEVEPHAAGSRFTASITMGTRVPIVGRLIDGLLRLVMGSRIEAIRRHQVEAGINLKRLLEPASD